ncbi:enoyl-CoA hydratase/isomerase family protein [Azoarcus olearius]|uniref:3-hydroxyisobutyryl-CoA hydrolase n=1 Tax=Azoarcus sp. (strain BH72) TaxID=418699 RepID=A1K1H9_AZOSB|nr:enoyl-CoA hydratase/isomerase family protein [Azoarcus olearius]CAL92684.1 probable enoyl-CoA hydratase/isomerase [Azoarcus olearius]
MTAAVLLREIPTACGRRFGHATLNAERALNALSLEMIDLLAPQLDAWAADPDIVGVVLDGSGDKAFCAGGDVAALYRALRAHDGDAPPQAVTDFFEREYRLDYRIHTYPKPLLCWGHGIVMGGGIGLLAGASHRVATLQTRMAMPEITIGLYPDVGGSWFLPRMPGRAGLFLALTGAPLNAADARFAGLADFVLDHGARGGVLAALGATRWAGDAAADRLRLDHLLGEFSVREGMPAAPLRTHLDRIEAVVGRGSLAEIAVRLHALAADPDPWLAAAAGSFVRGAPSSAALSLELWRRARHLSLAEVFRLEYIVSVAATGRADFVEGVRALLIDKDRKPRWQHADVGAVDTAFIADNFRARFDGAHPLADLA